MEYLHKSLHKISDLTFKEMKEDMNCVFCRPPKAKILFETENFYVTFDLSPLIEGHVLVHTKAHIGCIAEIDLEIFEDFKEIKEYIGKALKEMYGAVSFFEHGRAGSCGFVLNDQICHHFHLHALPLSIDIEGNINERFDPVTVEDISELHKLYEQYGNYLFYENSKSNKFFYPIKDGLENHFLRTVVSNAIGFPERADYSQYSNLRDINKFIEKLKKYER